MQPAALHHALPLHHIHGGAAAQVESKLTLELERAWLQTLNLKCDILVSKFGFSQMPACTATPRHRQRVDVRALRRRVRGGAVRV
jgi:hypothetical protein